MKKRKTKIVILSLLFVLTLLGYFFLAPKSSVDFPGEVIGPNPRGIPEDELPVCNYDGVKFTNEPCYSPPDAAYL